MIWSPLRACISIRVDLIAYRDKVERDPGYAVITMEVVVTCLVSKRPYHADYSRQSHNDCKIA